MMDVLDFEFEEDEEAFASIDEVSDADLAGLIKRLDKFFNRRASHYFSSRDVELEEFRNILDSSGMLLIYD